MTQLFAGNVEVQYGQAYIELDGRFDGSMDDCFRGQNNGLCGAQNPAILFLVTGLHTGPVGMTINKSESDPGIDTSWDEIVEVSFQAPRGEIVVVEWAADEGARVSLPAGSYRARYFGLAMQAANDLDTNVDDVPLDTYRLDMWPAPPTPDLVIKQTSSIAAYWHENARSLSTAGR